MTVVGLAALLAGCGAVGPGDLVDSAGQPSASPSSEQAKEPEGTAAQVAAAECFPGTWRLDNGSLSALLAASGMLASDSIEGTSLVIAQADGTAVVEHIGLTYVLKAPPNPMLGGQAPTTTTITRDSSTPATYLIDETGTIALTVEAEEAPMTLTCDGSRLVEKVESPSGEIVYNRRD